MIVRVSGNSVARQSPSDDWLWIVENEDLERLLFDRTMMGAEFRRTCYVCTSHFLRHMANLLTDGMWSELLVLSKGAVYEIGLAASQELDLNLPTNLIATARAEVEATDAEVEASYARYDAGGDSLVIGDTVASGATIETALRHYGRVHPVKRVLVFSFAGSLVGARRVHRYCTQRGIEFTALYGLAAFGLGENGFDLSFNHPETVCSATYVRRGSDLFEGKQVSSAGWDFGSQCMSPLKYQALSWLEAQVSGLTTSDVFAHARKPEDWRLVARESSAYLSALPDFPSAAPLDSV
jgi:hypothetical protein